MNHIMKTVVSFYRKFYYELIYFTNKNDFFKKILAV